MCGYVLIFAHIIHLAVYNFSLNLPNRSGEEAANLKHYM